MTITDRVQHQKFMEYIKDKRPMTEKLPAMREYFYKGDNGKC